MPQDVQTLDRVPADRRHVGRSVVFSFITLLLLALASTTASAQDGPIVDYRFDGGVTDTAAGSSIEVFETCPGDPCNSVSEFGSDSVGTFWRWESTNARGGGFRITTGQELGETYTVGLRFSFDQVGPSWRKIIDYKDRAEDTGFYFYDSAIEFYPYPRSVETFSAGEVLDLLAVRQGTAGAQAGTFTVYAIGESGSTTPILSIDDQDGDSIPATSDGGSLLGFFFDDVATGSEATSGGKVYSVRIWDRALGPSELVEALDEGVEEETELHGSAGLADIGQSRMQLWTVAVLLSLVMLTLLVWARVRSRRP